MNTCTLVHTTFTQYCTYSYYIYTCLYTIYTYILLYISHVSTYHCIFRYLFTFTTCCMHQYITNNHTLNCVVNLIPGLCMSKEKIKLCTSLLGCACVADFNLDLFYAKENTQKNSGLSREIWDCLRRKPQESQDWWL